ncbi:hypothetical protein I0C86_06040 [Plantactinospora sp. S1510]|uniref:Uncharacterized protein n=1 Tax=Plantactinospora alkalitolerans TaxID=2789879 RepID=A0ABS0GR39_9ACTN|nr:hypothetical protein [Plantactinospora alkalitolerans]MBF9128551.1 hypothetical protein [Plantactinospora alkalitolerans]
MDIVGGVILAEMIDNWHDGVANIPAARRALAAGASQTDLTQLARAVAYGAVFAMLYHLDDDAQATAELPSWTLAETSPAGHTTRRHLNGLYEDLLALDPSGREGQDLWNQ